MVFAGKRSGLNRYCPVEFLVVLDASLCDMVEPMRLIIRRRASGAHAKEGLMVTVKSRFGHLTLETITFFLILGVLSMIWPAIIALFLGVLLLLQWFSTEPEVVMLVWAEVENVPIVVASFQRPGLPTILS